MTRAKGLFWPLLLWGFIIHAVLLQLLPSQASALGLPNLVAALQTLDLPRLITGWVQISYPLWFLNMLSGSMVLLVLVQRLDKRVVLGLAALWYAAGFLFDAPGQQNKAVTFFFVFGRYFIFFWLGVVLSDWVVKRKAYLPPAWMIASAVVSVLLLALSFCVERGAPWERTVTLLGLGALPLVLLLAQWLETTPVKALLDWAGRRSIILLCLHMIGIALLLQLAGYVGIGDPFMLVAFVYGGMLALTYAFDALVGRLGISQLFGFKPE